MIKRLILLTVCLQNLRGQSELGAETVLQQSALAKYDFSFLPELIAEFNGEQLIANDLLKLMEYKLATLPTGFLSEDELKQLTVSFVEKYYERKVWLMLAFEAGIDVNEGIAELELKLLEKEMGTPVLHKQFEFTGRKFSERVIYFAESKAMNEYFHKKVLELNQVNEAEALEYYFDNKQLFVKDERVRIKQIFSSFLNEKDKASAQSEIKKAMTRLNSGEEFQSVAVDYLFGEGPAKEGRTLPFFSKKELSPALQNYFDYPLQKVSDIIESDYGFHIIKIVERKSAGQESFDEVKEKLMSKMTLKRAESILHERIVMRMKKGGFKLYIKP